MLPRPDGRDLVLRGKIAPRVIRDVLELKLILEEKDNQGTHGSEDEDATSDEGPFSKRLEALVDRHRYDGEEKQESPAHNERGSDLTKN